MLCLENEPVTGHSCLFNMLQFIPPAYLDHLLSAFAYTESPGRRGVRASHFRIVSRPQGARVSAGIALAGHFPFDPFFPGLLLCKRNHLGFLC